MDEPAILTVWYHFKTAAMYTVIGTSICSTNGHEDERAVVYISNEKHMIHHRELSEFMDGRFRFVEDASPSTTALMLMRMRDRDRENDA